MPSPIETTDLIKEGIMTTRFASSKRLPPQRGNNRPDKRRDYDAVNSIGVQKLELALGEAIKQIQQ